MRHLRRLSTLLPPALALAVIASLHWLPLADSAQAQTAQTVQADWGCIPSGITAGQSFRLLFVTSTKTQATSSDIATYNSFVQARALTHDCFDTTVSGQFKALISTPSVDARDNTATAPAGTSYTSGEGVPIYWLGGDKVADDYPDLYDGASTARKWDSCSGKNETGGSHAGGVWTGSASNGTGQDQNEAGTSATKGEVVNGHLGRPNCTSPIQFNVQAKTQERRLYALSPVFTVQSADITAPSKPTALARKSPSAATGTDSTPTITVTVTETGGSVTLYSDSTCTTAASAAAQVTDTTSPYTVDVTAHAQTSGAAVSYYAKHTDTATNASACSTATVSYTYTAPTTVWTSTLTVDVVGSFAGCDESDQQQANCSANLSPPSFTYSGTTYTVRGFYVYTGTPNSAFPSQAATGNLTVVFNPLPTASVRDALTLRVGSTDLALADGATAGANLVFTAGITGWSDGDTVSLRMTSTTTQAQQQPSKPTALARKSPSAATGTDSTPTITVTVTETGGSVTLYSDSTCTTAASAAAQVTDTTSPYTVDVTAHAQTSGAAVSYYARHTKSGAASACSTATVSYTYTQAQQQRQAQAEGSTGGICDRTLQVQKGIMQSLSESGKTVNGTAVAQKACGNYTAADLANLKTFRWAEKPEFMSLKSGDFAGMIGLTTLDIQNNEISELPADIFDGLDAVTDLRFSNNNIEDLPAGVFSGLAALRILVGSGNRLTHFKADWFDGFEGFQSGSTRLEFVGNQIATIDADALDGMAGLQRFYFSYNKIRSLPAGLFNGAAAMRFVSLHFNELETLPAGLFDRLTADGTAGSNATLTRVNANDNNLRSLPSGIFDNLTGLLQVRLHNNSLTSLPRGVFDKNAALQEVRLSNNQITSLPRGLFSNNPSLFYLHINDNRIRSLDGVGLDDKAGLLNFHLHNNALTQFPDAFVTNFVDDGNEASPNNCMLRFTFDNNPFSEAWIQSGKLSDVLTAFGRRTGGCEALGAQASLKYAYRLGVGGIDLDVDVTGRDKTAWQLLLDDFAASDRYHIVFQLSFGWNGQVVDSAVIDALPTILEELKIQDARFDSAVTGTSFARFTKTTANQYQYFFRRPDDLVLNIDHVALTAQNAPAGLPGLQVLRLDNVGLTGDGSRILTGLPVSTMRLLAVTNNPRFNRIPAGVKSLTNLVGLDLKSNGITSLDANGLQGLSNLLFLSVEDNEVATLDEDAFDGLSALRTLLMDDNEIATLPGGLFSGLSALRDVHLTNNELLGLPNGLFSGVDTLRSIGLQSNPGAPFQIGVSVVDDATDATMKQLHIREGAPYATTQYAAPAHGFTAKIVKDGAVSSVVPVGAGTTMTTQAFTIPEGARVVLPAVLPYRPSSTWEFCLGLDECFSGFEFVLDPKPSVVGLRFVQRNQLYKAGDKLRFEVQFDRDVVVEGKPQLSFMLGDETRYATYVKGNPHSTLYFEYTLQESDPAPNRISMASSMLRYPSGSSIKDPVTDTVAATTPRRTRATSEALSTSFSITYNVAQARISRIASTVRSVTVSSGDRIRLGVDVYGAQDIKDNDLADGIGFLWDDGDGGGEFEGNGREVTYTVPDQPGTYTISVATPFSACRAPATDEIRCETTFVIRVRRPSATRPEAAAPVNPPGDIPSIIADPDGNQYEVFTPVEGGTFSGEGYSISAVAGAVPNGEFVGVRMSDEGEASNVGMTRQRYTLGGNMYAVSAVDGSGAAVVSYVLDAPATVCVPLPDELRQNISGLAVVAINGDGSLTVLSAQVRISSVGTMVCGGLSNLPASVAVGSAGAPAPLPTAGPEPTPEAPDTGGAAPRAGALIWLLLIGISIGAIGATAFRRRSARTPSKS